MSDWSSHVCSSDLGFLFTRLQHALLHEAYWMIEQVIVTAADVDTFARRAFGPRMCVTGVIEQKDLSGIDTHALAQQGIVPHLHHGAEPDRKSTRLNSSH